jgi:hypothetical protein
VQPHKVTVPVDGVGVYRTLCKAVGVYRTLCKAVGVYRTLCKAVGVYRTLCKAVGVHCVGHLLALLYERLRGPQSESTVP